MHRSALAFSSILLGLAALVGPPATDASAKTAPHRDRCRAGAHERAVARSGSAVVLLRRSRTLIGCSVATGRRRVIDEVDGPPAGVTDPIELFDVPTFEQVHLHGTWVTYVITAPSRYADTVQQLYRGDAVHANRAYALATGSMTDVAIGPGGVIGYVSDGAPASVLRLDRPGRPPLVVDRGLRLGGVRFFGDRLSWKHGAQRRSADTTPTDRCAKGASAGGTLTLAITTTTSPSSVTACVRATGASRTLAAGPTQSFVTAGSWIATAPADGTVLTANVASTAGETIATGAISALAINANGTVAWVALPAPGESRPVFLRDATGTRMVDTNMDSISFGFDDTILCWGSKRLKLPV